ncbi:LacI family DNA-binding transcriptional regulator [Pseudobutyrivibrio xylanivorans]|uniref:LacI family transcriptional regulator n=1 Tax=Pseudobutyrivibrio xylanivorans TaxID=185007 RepID=A0A5P6VM27_PSEXY|nr:LacI family DNA-binding transcriptional regulator [Pseudobutyrivibrio xylanivorans]QFJ53713.1 LacI family transcriptional regulator [Pseudobutyrivibrio xylanivorans]
MAITTNDLAKLCGVSRTTVIRALNNTGRINDTTKQMILKTAEDNGYKPDLLARSLAKGRTYTIGMVVLDSKNRYFAQMISAVSAEAEKLGYGVNINLHNNDPKKEMEKLKRMAAYKMDGIILSSINEGDEYREFLEGLGIPIVSVDNKIAEGIPFVDISQRKAMKTATEKVVAAGYKKLVFVCPPIKGNPNENIYVHQKRMEGFKQAVDKAGAKVKADYLLDWDYLKHVEKYEVTKDTAFVCTADEVALDIMMLLKNKGLEAGKNYGLHGFDAIDTLKYISPRLNSVNNNVELVSKEAMNLLFQYIDEKENDKSKRIIVPFELVDGETV